MKFDEYIKEVQKFVNLVGVEAVSIDVGVSSTMDIDENSGNRIKLTLKGIKKEDKGKMKIDGLF